MRSNGSSDLLGVGDLPTTEEDVLALRRLHPAAGGDWLAQLTSLAAQVPQAPPGGAVRQRRTFAGLAPFEL